MFPIIGLAKLNYSKRNAARFPDPSVFGSGACKSGHSFQNPALDSEMNGVSGVTESCYFARRSGCLGIDASRSQIC